MSNSTLVTIFVDEKPLQVHAGTTVVEALAQHDVIIPTLCWSKEQSACLGTCRVCTVKINDRYTASCTQVVEQGMKIHAETDELKDLRQGVVELLFVEGNHFCPSCEKSGDCELQGVAYEMGMTHPRFHYRFRPYELDFKGEHLVLERNRCIHCKRCTDLFVDDAGKKVFSFVGRGKDTRVVIDFRLEAELSLHKVNEVVALCPVGALLHKGKGFDRPIGQRKYDHSKGSDS